MHWEISQVPKDCPARFWERRCVCVCVCVCGGKPLGIRLISAYCWWHDNFHRSRWRWCWIIETWWRLCQEKMTMYRTYVTLHMLAEKGTLACLQYSDGVLNCGTQRREKLWKYFICTGSVWMAMLKKMENQRSLLCRHNTKCYIPLIASNSLHTNLCTSVCHDKICKFGILAPEFYPITSSTQYPTVVYWHFKFHRDELVYNVCHKIKKQSIIISLGWFMFNKFASCVSFVIIWFYLWFRKGFPKLFAWEGI